MKSNRAADDLFATPVFAALIIGQPGPLPQVAPRTARTAVRKCCRWKRPRGCASAAGACSIAPVEEGRLHFCELAHGSVVVCGQTLADQINELARHTPLLSGPAVPPPSYATNHIR